MEKQILKRGKRTLGGRPFKYDIAFRRMVALEYIEGDQSASEVASAYKLTKQQVHSWAQFFSKELALKDAIVVTDMTEQETEDLEQLKKQNEALKKSLEYERIKNFALETMIDLAKEELGVDLRKNSGAKQPKE
ncbi:MAG: transposase [Candidatus Paceibacterales bacterium]